MKIWEPMNFNLIDNKYNFFVKNGFTKKFVWYNCKYIHYVINKYFNKSGSKVATKQNIIKEAKEKHQMAKFESYGKCYYCNRTFSKKGITKHLQSCSKRKIVPETSSGNRNIQKVKFFHIIAEGKDYLSDYWLHLEAPAYATLEELDNLLRDVWLECCGHLSLFRLEDELYFSEPDENWEQEDMGIELGNVLSLKKKFYHEYDFGSTTYLMLKAVSEREGEIKDRSIKILSRNEPLPIMCSYCDKHATEICTECLWSSGGWLCDDCAKKHKCNREMFLSVVNSPRTGICGYSG